MSGSEGKLEPSPRSRTVRESASECVELALPTDANPLGFILGGRVMHLVDMVGAIAAMRHARRAVLTASVDYLSFLHPVPIGCLMVVKSSVNRAFRTSMEVGVKVITEDLLTGEQQHTCSAYLTFVAVDKEGTPVEVPELVPETDDEKRRYEEAGRRRALRLEMRSRALE